MIHMLSAFDLKPDEDLQDFRNSYAAFVKELTEAQLIVSAGPIGKRVADTPMDTDDERHQSCYSVMSFRDRPQLDAAYDHIAMQQSLSTQTHTDMYPRVTNAVFVCWEDD